jgi:hypothetical protein
MGALSYLNDRADPRVIEALTRKCGVCAQPPGVDCRHPWETNEPMERIVHLSRAQQNMDKRRR